MIRVMVVIIALLLILIIEQLDELRRQILTIGRSKEVHYLLPTDANCAIKQLKLKINGEYERFDRMVCHWGLK